MSLNKEPNAPYEAQQLALAFQEYIEAANEERAARERFQGHSWGYYGHREITRRDDAAQTFADKLNAYVDSRIALALGKTTP